jgi:hypothetical protein
MHEVNQVLREQFSGQRAASRCRIRLRPGPPPGGSRASPTKTWKERLHDSEKPADRGSPETHRGPFFACPDDWVERCEKVRFSAPRAGSSAFSLALCPFSVLHAPALPLSEDPFIWIGEVRGKPVRLLSGTPQGALGRSKEAQVPPRSVACSGSVFQGFWPSRVEGKAFIASERGPAFVQPLAIDVPDLPIANAVMRGDAPPRLFHVHVMVLSIDQGQENLSLTGHASLRDWVIVRQLPRKAWLAKRKVPSRPLQRRPVTEETHGGTDLILHRRESVSTKITPTPAFAKVGVSGGRTPCTGTPATAGIRTISVVIIWAL